ncbi:MAG: methyltransferase type 11 [Acidobacteria bacterium]|nr:methyltransferase type 11 [Acidobacteriota bacterium]
MQETDEPPGLALRHAIDGLLEGASMVELERASARLGAAYRRTGAGVRPIVSQADRLAYVAARLPSTFEASRAVLAELRRRAPALRVQSLLELGAGPAPGLWAARPTFPELTRATHVEIDSGMAELGRRLLAAGAAGAGVRRTWREHDVGRAREAGSHDLVLLAYVLGEMPAAAGDRAIDAAWDVTAGALVVIEPGTPAGAARALRVRERLIGRGARVAAPCPHGGACPLAADDWCHFGVRVSRSRLQRRLKEGRLAYEDEKYAYVALTRGEPDPCTGRVLRRPSAGPRRRRLRLCTVAGVREELVTRREGARYRAARKVRWGEGWAPAAPKR